MEKLFIIMGKSATGKDTLYSRVLKSHPELKKVILYTTRPIREGEKDGDEYHFTDEKTMRELEQAGRIIEKRCYHTVKGDWYYFTADDEGFESGDRFIMITTLEGYEKIRDYFGEDRVVPIYIEIDDVTRIERALNREKKEDSPCVAEVCRRYLADEEDFSEENLKRLSVSNAVVNDDIDEAMKEIEKILA